MKILFLCTANSCRSQIAEGYARHIESSFWEVKSAGSHPKSINLYAIKIMKEIGIDISSQQSKKLTSDMLEWSDLIITLCDEADKECPTLLSTSHKKRHWAIGDPALATGSGDEILENFRLVRNKIIQYIDDLLDEFKKNKNH